MNLIKNIFFIICVYFCNHMFCNAYNINKNTDCELMTKHLPENVRKIILSTEIVKLYSNWAEKSYFEEKFFIENQKGIWIDELKKNGYLNPFVYIKVEINKSKKLITPIIYPGNIYSITNLEIYDENGELIDIKNIQIHKNIYANENTINEILASIVHKYKSNGFPSATIKKSSLVVKDITSTVTIILQIRLGKFCKFKTPKIVSTNGKSYTFILGILNIKEGMHFDISKIEKFQNKIEASGLFGSIRIDQEVDEDSQTVQLTIYLEEAKSHSIGSGLSFSTINGPGMFFEITKNNIKDKFSQYYFGIDLSRVQRKGMFYFFQNDFVKNCSDLNIKLSAADSKQLGEKLFIKNVEMLSLFKKKFKPLYSLGMFAEQIETPKYHVNTAGAICDLRYLFSFKSKINNFKCKLKLENIVKPFIILFEDENLCVKNKFISSLKLGFSKTLKPSIIFQTGTIFSENNVHIPKELKFYGGGPSLMRGYKYETLSVLNDKNEPIGATSFLCISLEPKFVTSKSFQFVPFLDIGCVSNDIFPTKNTNIYYSYGFGARIKSIIGSIRIDIGFPINRRHGIDSIFEIYIAIGNIF